MIKLIFSLVLLMLSMLVLFRAPTNFFWLVAVALTNFPYIPMLLTGFSFYLGDRAERFHWPILAISSIAFIIFSLPIISGYRQTVTVPTAMNKIFPVNNEDELPVVFSLFKMFTPNATMAFQSFVYKRAGGKDLLADFYPAKIKTPASLVIVVHGGSWESGDNKQLPELNSYLASKGFNVAAITYRLAPGYKAPAPAEDVEDAIRFFMEHAAQFKVDTNNIILLGRSAGGQIVLSAAYTLHLPNIKGVINYYGPADMEWGGQVKVNSLVLNTDKIYRSYFGGLYGEVPEKFRESSALVHADRTSPPTLMIHGTIDPLVS
ncbi:MAG: alpha/beta hydrolase, partial [Ferruginibacter sp.]